MSDVLNPNSMLEAVRLTRAARLAEATTLIQRMLRGETAPDMALGAANEFAPTGREPPIIDAKAETIDETGGPLLNAAKSAQLQFAARFARLSSAPRRQRWYHRIDAARRVHAGHRAGSGKFIEAAHSNPAGAVCKSHPSRSRAGAFDLPLHVLLH